MTLIEFYCKKKQVFAFQNQIIFALIKDINLDLLYCTIKWVFSLTKSLTKDKTVRREAREKGCDHLKRDISGCKWLHPEFQCRPLIQYFHSGQNWPSLLVMLEQHGRSHPIIPGDAAKQWTVCDPGQTSALRAGPGKKQETTLYTRTQLCSWALTDFFFLQESDRKSTIATLLSHSADPREDIIFNHWTSYWELYSVLEELRLWDSIQAFLNLWVKIGTWMTSFTQSQWDEGPLSPKDRKTEGRKEKRKLWGKEKDRERDVDGPRLSLP